MLVRDYDDKNFFDLMQEKNLLRQYDYMSNCIEIGLSQGPHSFDKYFLWSLNHIAVANISQFGGRFRVEPIYVGDHVPPHYKDVPELVDRYISFIHENWFVCSPTMLAAYGLWLVAVELDPPVRGGQWSDGPGCLLLSVVRAWRGASGRAKDVARANTGEPPSLCGRS